MELLADEKAWSRAVRGALADGQARAGQWTGREVMQAPPERMPYFYHEWLWARNAVRFEDPVRILMEVNLEVMISP